MIHECVYAIWGSVDGPYIVRARVSPQHIIHANLSSPSRASRAEMKPQLIVPFPASEVAPSSVRYNVGVPPLVTAITRQLGNVGVHVATSQAPGLLV